MGNKAIPPFLVQQGGFSRIWGANVFIPRRKLGTLLQLGAPSALEEKLLTLEKSHFNSCD